MQLDLTRLKTPNFQSLWVPVFGWDYCPLLRYGYGDLHHYHKFLIRTSPTLRFHHCILPSYGPAFHINLKQKSTTLSYLNCIKRSNEGFLSRKKNSLFNGFSTSNIFHFDPEESGHACIPDHCLRSLPLKPFLAKDSISFALSFRHMFNWQVVDLNLELNLRKTHLLDLEVLVPWLKN